MEVPTGSFFFSCRVTYETISVIRLPSRALDPRKGKTSGSPARIHVRPLKGDHPHSRPALSLSSSFSISPSQTPLSRFLSQKSPFTLITRRPYKHLQQPRMAPAAAGLSPTRHLRSTPSAVVLFSIGPRPRRAAENVSERADERKK